MGFKIKNSLTGEFEKLPILTLKGEKGETGGVEEYNKVDYMGNKYETLKQANDANVEYAVKTAIGEFNYLDYEGQNITATNTLEGRSKSAILKGQTLVNLVPEKIIDYTATSDWDGFNALGQNSATQESWRTLQDLKPNTKYFISCYVETFNVGEGQYYLLNNPNNSTVFAESLEVRATGLHKWVLTSKSELTEKVSIVLRSQNAYARGAIKIRDFMIIEYQEGMENWDIPYFEGMTSVKAPVLTTTGSNIIKPFEEWEKGGSGATYTITGKRLEINATAWNSRVEITQQLKPNTTYSVGWDAIENVAFRFSNTNRPTDSLPFKSFTTDESGKITFILKNSVQVCTMVIDGFRINEGDTDLGYEPYKSNILTTPEDLELRGIGKVKDELNVATGELTQRIGEIVLDGSENWVVWRENDNSYGFALRNYKIDFKPLSIPLCNRLVGAKYHYMYDGIISKGIALYTANSTTGYSIFIRLPKTECAGLEDFKTKLQASLLTVQYELETPTVKTVDLSDNHVYSYKGTTHYACSSEEGSLVPTLSVKVPTDVQATIAQQRETIQTLNSENERLNQIQEALKASMLDSQVQLMNLSWNTDFEVFTLRESIATKDSLMDSRTGSNIDKFSQAKFIIENDCPDLEKLNSQIEYYFSKDVFSQEQFEELTDLISIVKGENGCEY